MTSPRLKTARPRAQLREGRTDWYRITNLAGVATIHLYDEIGYFGVKAGDFVKEIHALDTEQITIHINSPGGEVFDGMAIYQGLKNHKARVTVVVDSLAASIASVIAMAGDEVIMARNATMMIHDGHGMAVGNAADMRELADLLDKTSDNIASVYAERTGQPTEQWRTAMRAETWYTAEEAVTAGLADKIQGQEAPGKPGNTWDLSIFNYSGRENAPAPVTPEPPAFQWNPDVFRAAMEAVK